MFEENLTFGTNIPMVTFTLADGSTIEIEDVQSRRIVGSGPNMVIVARSGNGAYHAINDWVSFTQAPGHSFF